MKRFASLGTVVALVLVAAGCLQGPITGPGVIALSSGIDPGAYGYQRSEWFLTGVAKAYEPTAPLTTDGEWSVTERPPSDDEYFKTRLVVHRPVDPARFNGTVVVEWLNVSAGADLANDYVFSHNELVRSGAAYVAVSAQARGVDQLRASGAARYGSLHHPGDSHSYSMFSLAGAWLRAQPDRLLGGLVPQRLIATGESQSAGRLVTYLDAVHPSAQVYDGFMVHSRSAGGAPLTQSPLSPVDVPSPLMIRDDLDVPVMVVQAEGDVINSNLGARQPDTPRFRSWELAGTSHADSYMVNVGFNDIGDGQGAVQMLELMRTPQDLGCGNPINAGPHHWLFQKAMHDLDVWVRTGVAPAVGPLLQVASSSPTVLARDAFGNALGGVRSPQVDAPVATINGLNTGDGFCRLFGTTVPFTPSQLLALYPTHADFVAAWHAAALEALQDGFLLPADAFELVVAAQLSSFPN